jgi:hypothetical protein
LKSIRSSKWWLEAWSKRACRIRIAHFSAILDKKAQKKRGLIGETLRHGPASGAAVCRAQATFYGIQEARQRYLALAGEQSCPLSEIENNFHNATELRA